MPRVNRQTHNRALFRAVNENIAEISVRFEVGTQTFFCECSQTGCTEILHVPAAVYDRVRNDPSRYLILPSHQDPAQEVIVEDSGAYQIVQAKPALIDAPGVSPISLPQS